LEKKSARADVVLDKNDTGKGNKEKKNIKRYLGGGAWIHAGGEEWLCKCRG